MISDKYNLQRFLDAQKDVYDQVIPELRNGRKMSHWMWFIFPQIAGLGFSSNSEFFAISNQDEARKFLGHPILGNRLRECVGLVLQLDGRSAMDIFGAIDAMKLASSMTLFAYLSNTDSIYQQVLDKYFDGHRDDKTLRLLSD